MTSEEGGLLGKGGGAPMLAVKVDRCCNRYWRLFLFLGLLLMSLVVAGMLLTGSNEQEQLLNNAWKDHWSEQQSSEKAKKTVLEQQGKNVHENVETFDEYLDSMDDHDDDNPLIDDDEYYDEDRPDVGRGGGKSGQDYLNQIQYDEAASKREKLNPAPLGVVPDVQDYSLQEAFKNMFRQELKETIQFDPHYKNPCWAESIPKYPYQTNSYLMVSEQARLLEPQFQHMRKIFATRVEDKWRLRCLPYYYVMETPPSAVPSLYTVLGYHPSVANPAMSEPEFWNIRGPDNTARLRDYLDLFDNAAEAIRANTTPVEKEDGQTELTHKIITGDGTSSYLWTIDSWKSLFGNENADEPQVTTASLIKKLTPKAKIIIVLRNPTDRLYQGYLQRTENPTPADFHEKVGQALEAMSKCVEQRTFRSCLYDSQFNKRLKVRLRIGMYYPFIEDYINTFGREQVKVIRYEDYVSLTSQVISEVCSFLKLQPFPTDALEKAERNVQAIEDKRKQSVKAPMMSTTRAMLKEFHKVLNEKLAEVLDNEKFTWPEKTLTEDVIAQASNQYQQQQQQQQQQQATGQQQSNGGQGLEATNKPKTFQEMLEKIRTRQRAALQQQQELRRRQMERIEQLRQQKAQQKQQENQGQQQREPQQQQQPGQPQQQQPGQQQQQGQQQPEKQNQNQAPQQPGQLQPEKPRSSPLQFRSN